MDRQCKVWGERWLIRQDSTHAVSFLKLELGYECSWHVHQTKYNLFVVVWGRIGVITEQLDGRLVETILTKGECFTTRPGQWHKFVVHEESGMIEEMYVQYDEGDIIRSNKGGPICKIQS